MPVDRYAVNMSRQTGHPDRRDNCVDFKNVLRCFGHEKKYILTLVVVSDQRPVTFKWSAIMKQIFSRLSSF